MKNHYLHLALCLSLFLCSCGKEKTFSFYHWKSKAQNSETIQKTLRETCAQTLYMHYFDVDIRKGEWEDFEAYPRYAIKAVDEEYKNLDIVPVVFITNRAMREIDPERLAKRIREYVDQISQHHFGKKLPRLQLDCDWSQSTRANYFQLIELLKKHYAVSVTIRLHQVKFPGKTGVPPVDKGVLMLYNVGDLKNESQNSILETGIVKEYIGSSTKYPMKLDLALPLFSQTVVKNKSGEVRLLNSVDKKSLDEKHFQPVADHLYEVTRDTLYRGFFLSKGYRLKLDEVTEETVIDSYNAVKDSKLEIENVIFYHLDEKVLESIDLQKIIQGIG